MREQRTVSATTSSEMYSSFMIEKRGLQEDRSLFMLDNTKTVKRFWDNEQFINNVVKQGLSSDILYIMLKQMDVEDLEIWIQLLSVYSVMM